ncbi:Nif3-like dinuclear metal center hexameric protein [Pseudalkalibacillus salsuginis]|uniref:Nif3-like dinuclear metal center hexameric protein n=1 Tax=Pseudalkalibacillus salsuginis TaxID=2910972 RepID=UPI002AFEFFD5|nr:Nif3-like dinuclear metal center hexameric protein [Pseudalkalibacillus salsuginis]
MSKKHAHAQEIIQRMEQLAPKWLAMEGDPIGLQVGSLKKRVKKVMVTLDVIEPVIDEAIREEVDLIISHHPLIYMPLRKINPDTSHGRTIQKLLKHDITLYAAHTNLDVAEGGVNDLLAHIIGIGDTEVLVETAEDQLKKLIVFVPGTHAEAVRDALGNAGSGFIGNYSHCTFNTPGTGTFIPHEGTNPHIGEQGKIEFVDEIKVETIYPASIEKEVIAALRESHPYEEVAYDLLTLENPGKPLGVGRIGKLQGEMTVGDLAEQLKKTFKLGGVRVVGDLQKPVKKIAVSGGEGNDFIRKAKLKGADVFITGDIKYHYAHDAWMEGMAIIDPGHNIEKVMIDGVADILEGWLDEKNLETKVYRCKEKTDPFQFI